MINKKDQSDPSDNLEYEKVLEEEIINSYESKLWFILYVISALSCVFYTPNRKALKELIAAWPNIEDLIKGRSLWRKGK